MSRYHSPFHHAPVLLWLLVGGLAFGACAKRQEVSFKSGGMTHTFSEGKEAVPHNFPVPIYPGATATGSVSAQADKSSEQAQFLMLSSADSPDKISSYYKQELPRAGWKVNSVQTIGNLVSLGASRDDWEANVMVSSEGDRSTISLNVSRLEPGGTPPQETGEVYTPDKLTPPTD